MAGTMTSRDTEVVVLGIDPSLRSTGLAVVSSNAGVLMTQAVRTGSDPIPIALSKIKKAMELYIRDDNRLDLFGISEKAKVLVAIEGYSLGSHASSGFTSVVEVGGVAKSVYGDRFSVFDIAPMLWKYGIDAELVKGRFKKGSKERNRLYSERIYSRLQEEFSGGPCPGSTDEVDAVAIASYVIRLITGRIVAKTPASKRLASQLAVSIQ